MALTVMIGPTPFSIPESGDINWADALTAYLKALATAFLQIQGGTFALTGELDVGTIFGIKSPYFKSATANPASTGVLRLAKTDAVSWRNNANGADVGLAIDANDNLLWNSAVIAGKGITFTGNPTGPGLVATGGSVSGDGVDGFGTGSGTGGMFQAASLTTPVRGSINLPPVAADPTAPIDGDVWINATNPFAQIGGAKKTLAALETAQTWTANQTFPALTTAAISASGDVSTTGNVNATGNVAASGNVSATGTVNAAGYQQGGSAISLFAAGYASLIKPGSPTSRALQQVTGSTYTDLASSSIGFGISGPSANCTYSAGTDYITVTNAGNYMVSATASLSSEVGGSATVGFRVIAGAAGGPADVNISADGRSGGAGQLVGMAASRIIALNAADVVKLQLYTTAATAADNVGIDELSLTVNRVG